MRVSVCFMTGREEPHLDWALDAIGAQAQAADEIEVIVIDALAAKRSAPVIGDHELTILDRSPSVFQVVRLSAPKPNLWQGPHRVTSCDWWATSNARNTFLCLASYDYLAFLDDRGRPGPRWLATVRKGYEERTSVLAGSYDKLEGPEDARKVSRDHRRERCPDGKRNCGGGWLYGCTFALPLAWALKINGFEEGCDGLTGEDYIFGLMLGNAGHRIDFVPEMFVTQDRLPGNETCKGTYMCRDKGTSPNDKSHAALRRFGSRSRTELTPDLTTLRRTIQAGGSWPIPDPAGEHRDWYDRQPIREM